MSPSYQTDELQAARHSFLRFDGPRVYRVAYQSARCRRTGGATEAEAIDQLSMPFEMPPLQSDGTFSIFGRESILEQRLQRDILISAVEDVYGGKQPKYDATRY